MMPREGTLIADRYRLERKVGGGRVSAVWRVRDEISGRACAIKILHRSMHKHPEALTRFSLEDRLARELAGPHFPERVGSGVWDGLRYIAWRWHEGESLRALFERNPKQDAPTVHSIVQETCQALAMVHAAGYCHGDLKPENIFFADRDAGERARQLKLLGFGVASRLSRASAAGFGVGRRRPGEIVGTPLYLSPDLILGRVPNGGQADLWALAVIVYEALTGRPPFLGSDLGAVLQAILEKRAPRPGSVAENLPGSFDAWWAQALAQEFDTPGEFAGALARALAPALRSSHTQRSASLPERPPATLELTPMPSSPPAASTGAPATPKAMAAPPSAPAAASAAAPAGVPAATAPAAAPAVPLARPNASTATGIGPAEQPRARAPSDPALRVEASQQRPGAPNEAPSRVDASPTGKFAPLPLPLRDLSADMSRKTLVGITPPAIQPSTGTGHANTAARASASRATIAGTPIRPIETRDARADTAADPLRRPAHPTVPFPRPRVAPRNPAYPADDLPDLGRTWQGTSTRTLRFVLTSRDHKPQRIAAALVCAAAALVIFVVGRSPISGTASIGQTTESLSAERGQKAASGGFLADPARSELAIASGSERTGGPNRPDVLPPAEPPTRPGVELAPGLVVPPAGSSSPPASDLERAAPPGLGASLPAGSASSGTNGPASGVSPAGGSISAAGDAAAPSSGPLEPTPPRAKPAPRKPPAPPPSSPPPPRKPSGDLDFGI